MRNLGRSSESWVEVSQMDLGQRVRRSHANEVKHRKPWPVWRNIAVIRSGIRVLMQQRDRTWHWRNVQVKSLYFLPVAWILSKGCGKPLEGFQQDSILTTAGRKDEKDRWWAQGHQLGITAAIQVKNNEVTCSSCLTSSRPQVHACWHFGFSIQHAMSIWKLLFLPFLRVTVLIIILLIYWTLLQADTTLNPLYVTSYAIYITSLWGKYYYYHLHSRE